MCRQRINSGDLVTANKIADSALKVAEKIHYESGSANALSNIGIIECFKGKYTTALQKHQEALKIRTEKKLTTAVAGSYINMGAVYDYQRNFNVAEKYYNDALKIFQQAGPSHSAATAFNAVAMVYIKHPDPPVALKNFLEEFESKSKSNGKDSLAESYNQMGVRNLGLRKLTEAREFFRNGLQRSQESKNIKGITDSYLGLAKTDSAQGNYQSALAFYKLYAAYKDSLAKDELEDKIERGKMQYEFDKKQLLQRAEKEKTDARLQKQRIEIYALIGGSLLLILVALLVYNRYRIKRTALQQLKSSQEQLIRQEKLASLGQLTAGIAHEIKNPLNFVNNFSESSEEILDELQAAATENERNSLIGELKQNLQKISHHGRRADSIVKNMLDHSRSATGEKQLTDLNMLCDEFFNISYHGMKANHPDFNCRLDKKFSPDLQNAEVITQDLSRVLLNLFNNAFQAVYEKSKVDKSYEPVVTVSTESTDDSKTIRVRDNGSGIPQHLKEKIFEPFFTTKPAGQGTGLGLSLSYDIIKMHDGELKVESRQNEFTEFIIVLPA